MQISKTIITFPDIKLNVRDAHKLRGYFGNLFKEKSPLLHNHLDTGETAYKYPLIQYKVIDNIPTIVGLNDGADLLTDLFLKISEIDINGAVYPIHSKNISKTTDELVVTDEIYLYHFKTLWMGLSQSNHKKFINNKLDSEKNDMLCNILIGNVLSFYKAFGFITENRILLNSFFNAKHTKFKDRDMLVFDGSFNTNAKIPDCVGLGRSVSRGFGSVGVCM